MSRNYTLNVKDFGPTADASVDMRPLTVFVGPSNTGKSYLATLIYALHRCLRDPGELPELPDQAAPDPDVLTSAMLAQWAAATARSRADTGPGCLPDLPEEVNEFVKSFPWRRGTPSRTSWRLAVQDRRKRPRIDCSRDQAGGLTLVFIQL